MIHILHKELNLAGIFDTIGHSIFSAFQNYQYSDFIIVLKVPLPVKI